MGSVLCDCAQICTVYYHLGCHFVTVQCVITLDFCAKALISMQNVHVAVFPVQKCLFLHHHGGISPCTEHFLGSILITGCFDACNS